jgi:hypothetical protein
VKKPKAGKEDASTIALREQQILDLSKLDEQENSRIKDLLVGQRGGRFFRGAPLLRARPSNTVGTEPVPRTSNGITGSGTAQSALQFRLTGGKRGAPMYRVGAATVRAA